MATKTTTKTAAAEAPKGMVKDGGAKGAAIVEVIKKDRAKKMTRKEVAQAAGCTVGRVGELVRFYDGFGTDAQKALVAHLVKKAPAPKADAPKGKAPAKATTKTAAKAPAKKAPARRAPKASDIKTEEDAVKAVHAIVEG